MIELLVAFVLGVFTSALLKCESVRLWTLRLLFCPLFVVSFACALPLFLFLVSGLGDVLYNTNFWKTKQ